MTGGSFCSGKKSKASLHALFKRLHLREWPLVRQLLGEFVGTTIFIVLGCGNGCQEFLGNHNLLSVDIDFKPTLESLYASANASSAATTSSNGSNAQTVVKVQESSEKNAYGDFFSTAFGWGIGVMVGLFCAGRCAPGHVNPAVSIAMALRGHISWLRALLFSLVQIVGAFVGALVVYFNYKELIAMHEMQQNSDIPLSERFEVSFVGGPGANDTLPLIRLKQIYYHMNTTGMMFVTTPFTLNKQPILPITVLLADEMMAAAIFLFGVFAITDRRNFNIPAWMQPFFVGLLVFCIINGFALNSQAAFNPARDLGPRFMLLVMGWGPSAFRHANYFFWIPTAGATLGGILGMILYELLVGAHLPSCEQDEGFNSKKNKKKKIKNAIQNRKSEGEDLALVDAKEIDETQQ